MSPGRRRVTELDDQQHVLLVSSMMDQHERWLTHDDERVQIISMSPPHALSAYRKLVEYAREGMLPGYDLAGVVASPLGAALRTQAMGDDATQAEIQHLKARARNGTAPKTVVVSGNKLRTSLVLAAVEDLEDEILEGAESGRYAGAVDYAVRLTQLINERLQA